ncbi:MAG: siphovirus Gp157 family protein [Thermodesulfobacteriota bacterium]
MKLYEISDNYLNALQDFADMYLTDEEINDTIEGIEGEFKDKAINIAAFIKNLEVDSQAIHEAEKSMAYRRRVIENKIDKLRDYLLYEMEQTGITKITDSPYFVISLKNNPPKVVIENEEQVPSEFVSIETIKKIDKKAILAQFKPGDQIPGLQIVRNKRLDIR